MKKLGQRVVKFKVEAHRFYQLIGILVEFNMDFCMAGNGTVYIDGDVVEVLPVDVAAGPAFSISNGTGDDYIYLVYKDITVL